MDELTGDAAPQAGKMVGVEAEERVSTSWLRSFRFRHPWLQLNLLTAIGPAGLGARNVPSSSQRSCQERSIASARAAV